ncbi:MAG TPA: gliding motility-associated C-terminal domain-containing protein, partial [Saprospiraceae bacterium]
CVSSIVQVNLSVSTQVDANPLNLGYCLLLGDTLQIDLTFYDTAISGGSFQVHWFVDSLAVIPVINTGSFTAAADTTLYVYVSDGLCISSIELIDFAIQTLPVASPFSINRCGDANGLVTVDLITVESAVSNNVGTVYWWVDPGFTIPLSNIDSLVTSDTVVYANVVNGSCFSEVVPVTVTVVDSLQATPVAIEVCVVDAVTATIDLTQYDLNISNGGGPVFWFEDALQTVAIANPQAYVTSGDTLFAIIIADGCISNLAQIPVVVEFSVTPVPSCLFTSIDSIAISWPPMTQDYELSYSINGQLIGSPFNTASTIFNAGGLGQGDTLTLSVSAIYNGICNSPLTTSITCITDVCPPQTIAFIGLDSVYCSDETFIAIHATPPGGVLTGQAISGDTLYPALANGSTTLQYSWENITSGCVYNIFSQVVFDEPLEAPQVDCGPVDLDFVVFDWTSNENEFGYWFVINQGAPSAVVNSSNKTLTVSNLLEGDSVTLYVWAVGNGPCGNSDTVSTTCYTRQCPQATVDITDPGGFCSGEAPVQLEAIITGLTGQSILTWSGNGIINSSGIFDPGTAFTGNNLIQLEVDDLGCLYASDLNILVNPSPDADFVVDGEPCLDSLLTITFIGEASTAALFDWQLDGGNLITDNRPTDFTIQWDEPGTYIVTLSIDDGGCVSDTHIHQIKIEPRLEVPIINCIEEDYYSLSVEWEPVPGATSYNVLSSSGSGTLSGTTYTIRNLTDNTPVTIEVVAIGSAACGPTSATIECRTLDYIPPQTFIPNVFSPNGDGINDVFFIQTNDRITEVVSFRIFDRWGNVVFEDYHFLPNEPQHGWDGRFKEKIMNPAVFTFLVELKDIEGKPIVKPGEVTLLR